MCIHVFTISHVHYSSTHINIRILLMSDLSGSGVKGTGFESGVKGSGSEGSGVELSIIDGEVNNRSPMRDKTLQAIRKDCILRSRYIFSYFASFLYVYFSSWSALKKVFIAPLL
jgi:hypothetical protein